MPAVGRGALTPPLRGAIQDAGRASAPRPGVGIDTAEKLRTGHDVKIWNGAPYQAIATSLGEAFCLFIFFVLYIFAFISLKTLIATTLLISSFGCPCVRYQMLDGKGSSAYPACRRFQICIFNIGSCMDVIPIHDFTSYSPTLTAQFTASHLTNPPQLTTPQKEPSSPQNFIPHNNPQTTTPQPQSFSPSLPTSIYPQQWPPPPPHQTSKPPPNNSSPPTRAPCHAPNPPPPHPPPPRPSPP